MSSFQTSQSKTISIDNLIALNDEIAALVAGGVPLELGLHEIGADHNSTLRDISQRLGDHMSQGKSLPDALAAEGERFPRLYRVVVEAGLRAGRLPAALEAVSSFVSATRDLRTRIGLALLYPLIILGVAYGLFLLLVLEAVARIDQYNQALGMPTGRWTKLLLVLNETMGYWWWILPILVSLLMGYWLTAGRAKHLGFEGMNRPLRLIPGVHRIVRNHHYANFADLLAMLVDHNVVLDEALILAADVTTDSKLQASARTLADAVRRGDVRSQNIVGGQGFPPFLGWLILRGLRLGALPSTLRRAADMYRRRAATLSEWLKLAFPIIVVVFIGGGVTLFYGLGLFMSFVEFLHSFGLE